MLSKRPFQLGEPRPVGSHVLRLLGRLPAGQRGWAQASQNSFFSETGRKGLGGGQEGREEELQLKEPSGQRSDAHRPGRMPAWPDNVLGPRCSQDGHVAPGPVSLLLATLQRGTDRTSTVGLGGELGAQGRALLCGATPPCPLTVLLSEATRSDVLPAGLDLLPHFPKLS